MADCSPTSAVLRAVTRTSERGDWVAASTTTPATLLMAVCAKADVERARMNARTARCIGYASMTSRERVAERPCITKESLPQFREHRLLHEVGRQEPLGEDGVVEGERIEVPAQLLFGRLAQLEQLQVTVVVRRGLAGRPEGEAVDLLGGEGGREAHFALQEFAGPLRRPLAHLQLRVEKGARRPLQAQLQRDELALVGHVGKGDGLGVQP